MSTSGVEDESPAAAPGRQCARGCGRRARYEVRQGGELRALCSAHFVSSRPTLRRATITALLVGSILTLLNQGDVLLAGDATASTLVKVPLTYLVPFVVTIWGALGSRRD